LARLELPLIGLLEEVILPGEERALGSPAIDAATLVALKDQTGSRLAAITIASRVELPALVTARWGTECTVVAVDTNAVTLRGERRVRMQTARGKESPYQAEVEIPAGEATQGGEDRSLIAGAHALFAALDAGALPDPPDWPLRLRPALTGLLRALTTTDGLNESLKAKPEEALRNLANALAARSQGQHASCALEEMILEIAQKPDLPRGLKQRLWSQVVEIQKRLDIYDPGMGEEGDDLSRLQRRLMQAGLPKIAREAAKRELRLLRGMPSNHHDYSSYFAHLEFMARLPWHADPPRPTDLDAVAAVLEREHAGLIKPKQRVLEYLAVRTLEGSSASMILCLSGPPGVGKTSIARAIAGALGRAFVRVPLGGVHDESEIRGHRLSFVAASAGRLLKGLAQAGSASAVILLDEIDKVGSDRQRSPAAALLEVLDPEQNTQFQDNFLGVPYDLSHALFIATANETSHIHPTLLDRMEPVELEGYTAREKSEITRRHLLSRLREEHGLPAPLSIDDEALHLLIEGHTREAGVRQLRRALGALHRTRALALVRGGEKKEDTTPIQLEEVHTVLGAPRFSVKVLPEALPVGVATGLAVGPEGGSILFIEVGLMPGKGALRLTGRLGEVMQEAAHAALAHLRITPERYGATRDRLAADVHIHVPEAALAKDGPSAGITLFAALLSAVIGTPLRADVALTGELTLTGRVLPVGGVRAKLLAAERAGVRRVILPADNRADVPPDLATEIVLVREVDEVVRAAFERPPKPLLAKEIDPPRARKKTDAQARPRARNRR
jgi:endopeptidase La